MRVRLHQREVEMDEMPLPTWILVFPVHHRGGLSWTSHGFKLLA